MTGSSPLSGHRYKCILLVVDFSAGFSQAKSSVVRSSLYVMVVLLSCMLPISLNRGGYADSTENEG